MSLGSILKSIFGSDGFFSRLFKSIKDDADVVAITITEAVKSALESGAAGFIATIFDDLLKSHIAEDVLALLKKWIPDILAAELALKGLPDNPTEADFIEFEKAVMDAFGVTDQKSKLYTVLAAQIYGIIQTTVNNTPGKFADWVSAVEQAYQALKDDQEDTPIE